MKNFRLILLFVSIIFIAACGQKSNKATTTAATEVIPVKVMPLDQQSDTTSIAVSGQFTTDDEVYLSFKTGGIINRILVKEGDMVKKGQLLATLNLTEINAQADQVKLTYEKAGRDYLRIQALYKDSVYTLEQLQNAKTTLDQAQQQYNAIQFNRNYSEIHAVATGYILHKLANEGQVVTAGASVFQTNGAGEGNWLLRVGLSDKEWAMIHTNDKAIITVSDIAGKTYAGKVIRKTEGVDPATGSFGADIQLTGAIPNAIGAGMFGKAELLATDMAGSDKSWIIPHDALLDGDNNSGYVFITNDGKTANKLRVTVAGIRKDKVIISDGLQQAKELIISGSAYLTENSAIKIIQ